MVSSTCPKLKSWVLGLSTSPVFPTSKLQLFEYIGSLDTVITLGRVL